MVLGLELYISNDAVKPNGRWQYENLCGGEWMEGESYMYHGHREAAFKKEYAGGRFIFSDSGYTAGVNCHLFYIKT